MFSLLSENLKFESGKAENHIYDGIFAEFGISQVFLIKTFQSATNAELTLNRNCRLKRIFQFFYTHLRNLFCVLCDRALKQSVKRSPDHIRNS